MEHEYNTAPDLPLLYPPKISEIVQRMRNMGQEEIWYAVQAAVATSWGIKNRVRCLAALWIALTDTQELTGDFESHFKAAILYLDDPNKMEDLFELIQREVLKQSEVLAVIAKTKAETKAPSS